jgi:hypothetical protein
MSFSLYDPGCGCTCGCTITVLGCGSRPLAGALVEVFDAGDTLLDSATTGDLGTATLAGIEGVDHYRVSKDRFATQDHDGDPCGAVVTLLSADGYVCFADCAVPMAATVEASVTGIVGDVDPATGTLYLGAGHWIGTIGGSSALTLYTDGTAFVYSVLSGCTSTDDVVICGNPPSYSASVSCPDISGTIDVHE